MATVPNDWYDERNRLFRRKSELELERSTWINHWKELNQFILPRSGRFFITDRNRGDKRHNKIYDNTATRALRVLGAGLMSGATSPARPWFRLATGDPEKMKSEAVRVWLSDVTRQILKTFSLSNTYRSLHTMYEELGVYGTGAAIMMDDFETVSHMLNLNCGEYYLAANWKGDVDTMCRYFEATVENLVRQFGYNNCSTAVKNNYDRGNYGVWQPVMHIIEPRHDYDSTKRDTKNMPWKSTYFEPQASAVGVLRESGMREFRALTPRWNVRSGDVYGDSPGMETLGHIKEAQHNKLMKATAIDYQVRPPLQIPTTLKNSSQKRLPGGEYYYDQTTQGGGVRSAFEVRLDLNALQNDIMDIRAQINESFYKDLFLMLSSDAALSGKLTATQVAEIHEEKLLMLGPVIERLHNELLQRLVDMHFTRLLETGLLPPPPEEMQGEDLNVEFVSILAQAQRSVNTNSIDRLVSNIGAIAQYKPGILDKFDEDEYVDMYADMLGVDPSLIVPDDKVALIRKARADEQRAQMQAAQLANTADAASKLAQAPTDGKNALTDVMSQLQGYSTPGPAQTPV